MSVVFAAGFLVPQHIAGKDYFRIADVATRANRLADTISDAPGPIHIVAHSMAGLDARFLLANNLQGLANPGRVVSLSMISTPNLGSPVADLLAGPQPSLFDPRRITYDIIVQLAAEFGLSAGALGDLTSGFAIGLNPRTKNVPTVDYYCYAGAGMESFLLKPSHLYIQSVGQTDEDQANDGLVSLRSASWTPLTEPPWPTDHLGEVGYNLSAPTLSSTFDHIAAYRRILARAGA
jgi:triacylglycerol lipase